MFSYGMTYFNSLNPTIFHEIDCILLFYFIFTIYMHLYTHLFKLYNIEVV